MPGGDRTGPMGMGAMTRTRGRILRGFWNAGIRESRSGAWLRDGFRTGPRRLGRGFGGGGRGWRHMFYATGLPGWMRFGGYAAPYGYPHLPEARPGDGEAGAQEPGRGLAVGTGFHQEAPRRDRNRSRGGMTAACLLCRSGWRAGRYQSRGGHAGPLIGVAAARQI